jgi:two-component system NtrC family response regulator
LPYTLPIKKEILSKPLSLGTLKDFRETAVAEAEKQYLKNLIEMTNHNIKEACRISGLSRPRLYAFLKKFSLT